MLEKCGRLKTQDVSFVVGRAGRVAQGRVYRLVTYKFWHEHLVDYCEPEMRVSQH